MSQQTATTSRARRLATLPRGCLWLALAAVLALTAALIEVTISGPRVSVRWRADLTPADRVQRERQYGLRNGERDKDSASTWRYDLGDRSRPNIDALLSDRVTEDTHGIDREALTVPRPTIRVGIRSLTRPTLPFPFSTTNEFAGPRQLFQIQSGWLLLAGGLLVWTAGAASGRRRRNVMAGVLLLVGAAAWAFPISPSFVRMSDATQHIGTRGYFEDYAAVHAVRFEAHLTYAILGRLDRLFGRTETAPERAQTTLARAATVVFLLSALAVGFLGRWSPHALRYVALALLAPSALMYFGWREFGYLSLTVAAFPLIARGLRNDDYTLEAGSALIGVSAALHGWGLVSLAGACAAAAVAPAPLAVRAGRSLRVAAWGTAAYVGWVAVYIIVLKLPVTVGHAEAIPWRPWFADQVFDGRLNVAILSATGARDLLMTGWVVGAPLLVVAASLWHRHRREVAIALAYAVPSVLMTVLVWHTQGLREDMDVVFAMFPALYALAWICARDARRAHIAAVILASAHLAFWRVVLDAQFAVLAVD